MEEERIMRNIFVNSLKQTPIEQQKLEIVERKGLGHPDYICDRIMNEISIKLSNEYLARIGIIMHHNLDKALLVAGEVEIKFGGGLVKEPMKLVMGDRAIFEVDGVKIPVKELAVETAKKWIRDNLRFVDPEKHIKYQVEVKPGSPELVDLFKRKGKVLGANDTSAAVGYWPLSRLERIVLRCEEYLNSKDFKSRFPETGEDVKIMAFRKNNDLWLAVAMPFIDKYIDSEKMYFERKAEVYEDIQKYVKTHVDFEKVTLGFNTLDIKGRGINGVYLSVLGTSAESGDSGEVGRGNRVNGIIPLNRPYCSEAAAGKNPVSHVGKIYNVLTNRIARQIYEEVGGMEEVYVWLLGEIGRPIDQPVIAGAQVMMKSGNSFDEIRREIEEIIDWEFENIDKLCMDLAQGKIPIC